MTDSVQQIKDRLSIDVVVGQYVKLIKTGANYKARCPFHSERTPSFVVSPSRGTYHCFGCGAGGDLFSFVQEVEGLDFKGALKVLAERAGVQLTYEKGPSRDERDTLFAIMESATRFFEGKFNENDAAQAYVKDRGLTEETALSFRLGFAPDDWRSLVTFLKEEKYSETDIEKAGLGKRTDKGMYDRFRSRIMFPINDSAGRVVAFSGRIFKEVNSEQQHSPTGGNSSSGVGREEPPKYLNSPETPLFHKSRILYGYDRAKLSIRKYNCTVLVEGQMDLVMSHQAGWTNAVAVSGTALTLEHVALVHRLSDNLILALDADEAGIRAAAKSARIALLSGMDVKVAELPEGLDPADLIKLQGVESWNVAMRSSRHVITFLLDILERTQKDPRAFARAVEKAVVPFVASIKSPIDREHFVREVAGRINVPDQAIRDSLSRVPSEELVVSPIIGTAIPQRPGSLIDNARERQLIGLYLWQKELKKPLVDIEKFEKNIQEATERGQIVPEGIADAEKESLRFGAEGLYGNSENIEDEILSLLLAVRKEKLRGKLEAATLALRQAERAGDEAAVEIALQQCALLTGEIAKLDKVR